MTTKDTAINISELFPLLEITDEYILSKMGDITIAFELKLPAIHTLSIEENKELRLLLERAYSLLPEDTIILKQDWFLTKEYERHETDSSFLLQAHAKHFSGRKYLAHHCYIYLTLPAKHRAKRFSLESILCRKNIVQSTTDQTRIDKFSALAHQVISLLDANNYLSATQLTKLQLCGNGEDDQYGIIGKYMRFSNTPDLIQYDYCLQPERVKIGKDKSIINYTISSLEDLPNCFEENIKDKNYSTTSSTLYRTFLGKLGYDIPVDHIVNQYIVLANSSRIEKSLSHKSRFLSSFSTLSAQNAIHHEEIEKYLDETAHGNIQSVKTHVNILIKEENTTHNSIVSALTSSGIIARLNTYNTPVLFWGGIPGNSPDVGIEEYMTMPLSTAIAFTILESNIKGIEGGKLLFSDRITHIPIELDCSALAREKGLIDNYNVFTLGPSGSGKSFLTNEMITQDYYRGKAHCVVVDQGDSYYPLCQIINEETNGEDGIYFNYTDEYPFTFNPFIEITTEEDKTFIRALLFSIWGKKTPTASESSLITQAIDMYTDDKRYKERSLNTFRRFLQTDFQAGLKEPFRESDFDIENLLVSLRPFCQRGRYSKLLNSDSNVDLTNKRFILFEIDNISNDTTLFPIVTLLITKLFADKMKRISEKKVMLIEEAWRAIASPEMENWIQWLWKTARKHNAQAIVVTQEIEDIISSNVIKNSIINNSSTKILLDQKNLKDKYDEIANILALSPQDKNLIFSINRNLDTQYKYREAFIAIGTDRYVYAIETSPQGYFAYTTTKEEKVLVAKEAVKYGSYIRAIQELTKK